MQNFLHRRFDLLTFNILAYSNVLKFTKIFRFPIFSKFVKDKSKEDARLPLSHGYFFPTLLKKTLPTPVLEGKIEYKTASSKTLRSKCTMLNFQKLNLHEFVRIVQVASLPEKLMRLTCFSILHYRRKIFFSKIVIPL